MRRTLITLLVATSMTGLAAAQPVRPPPTGLPKDGPARDLGVTHATFARAFNDAARRGSMGVRAAQSECHRQGGTNICGYQFGRAVGMAGTVPNGFALDMVFVIFGGDTAAAVDALATFAVLLMLLEPEADAAERGALLRAVLPVDGRQLRPARGRIGGTVANLVRDQSLGWTLAIQRAQD